MATVSLLTVSDVLQLRAVVTAGAAVIALAGASGWYLHARRGWRRTPPAVEESAVLDLAYLRLAYHVGYRCGYDAGYRQHQEDADLYLRLAGAAGANASDTRARPGALPTVSGVLAEAERILQVASRRRPGAPGAPRP